MEKENGNSDAQGLLFTGSAFYAVSPTRIFRIDRILNLRFAWRNPDLGGEQLIISAYDLKLLILGST